MNLCFIFWVRFCASHFFFSVFGCLVHSFAPTKLINNSNNQDKKKIIVCEQNVINDLMPSRIARQTMKTKTIFFLGMYVHDQGKDRRMNEVASKHK